MTTYHLSTLASAEINAECEDQPNKLLCNPRVGYIMKHTMAGHEPADLIVMGITGRLAFKKENVERFRKDIEAMLMELPTDFRESSDAKGMSFLAATEDRHGKQWTGLQKYMEAVFVLGMAIGRVRTLLPRELWSLMPGGVPYYQITDNVIDTNAAQALDASDLELQNSLLGKGAEEAQAILDEAYRKEEAAQARLRD